MHAHLTKLFVSPSTFNHLVRRPRLHRAVAFQARRPMSSTVTRAITPAGEAVPFAGDDNHVLERISIPQSSTVTLLLNRPKALNALTRDMCLSLYQRLQYIDRQTIPSSVILRSSEEQGRAFCAGGDVRALYHAHRDQGVYLAGDENFRAEYRLISLLSQLKQTSVVAVMDGITMGGGVGISIHGRWRIATERTVVAMPECILGIQPDVGACFIFPRLPIRGFGAYLALTGARVHGQDVVRAGIATHFVPSEAIKGLYAELERNGSQVEGTLEKYSMPVMQKELSHQSVIEKCFLNESVEEVISALEDVAGQGNKEDSDFAKDTLTKIRAGCPTAVKIVWEGLKRGAAMDRLDEWMTYEFRLAVRMIRREDFASGVRSALVTKDRNPTWQPSRLQDLSENDVLKFFGPLEEDLGIPEIDLNHDLSTTDARERPKL